MLLYFIVAILAAYLGPSLAAWPQAEVERACFTTAETREKILAHGLYEPFHVMRSAATRLQAKAIGVKLCRRAGELIYELSLLRHDGHLVRLSVDAKTGQLISSKAER
jgi:uncharacterized membrane protein YkoI